MSSYFLLSFESSSSDFEMTGSDGFVQYLQCISFIWFHSYKNVTRIRQVVVLLHWSAFLQAHDKAPQAVTLMIINQLKMGQLDTLLTHYSSASIKATENSAMVASF